MLVEIGIGDAFGRPFEFNTREFIDKNNVLPITSYKHREAKISAFDGKFQGAAEKVTGIGTYTDDAQMSMAVAEHMLANVQVRDVSFAHRFLEAYGRDPRGGYSRRISGALNDALDLEKNSNPKISNGIRANHFLKVVNPAGLSSNGCVMRTVPLGLLSDPKDVIHRSIIHCSSTHASLDAIKATIAVSLTAHYLYHEVQDTFLDWMIEQMGATDFMAIIQAWDPYSPYFEPEDGIPCDAMKTAAASIAITFKEKSMQNALHKSIQMGGDVDSVAAVTMGLMSLKKDVLNDLPKVLYTNLENGAYGRDYMKLLDKRLFDMFPVNKVSTNVLDI